MAGSSLSRVVKRSERSGYVVVWCWKNIRAKRDCVSFVPKYQSEGKISLFGIEIYQSEAKMSLSGYGKESERSENVAGLTFKEISERSEIALQ
jgi:hypothetical protein